MKNITVRRSTSGDESALARLAALDSASPPRGPALVAEADSRMLAALPLGSGRPIADPFEPTAEVVALLELRREQMESADGETGQPAAAFAACSAAASPTPPRTRLRTPRGSNPIPSCERRRPTPSGRRRFAF